MSKPDITDVANGATASIARVDDADAPTKTICPKAVYSNTPDHGTTNYRGAINTTAPKPALQTGGIKFATIAKNLQSVSVAP